MKYYLKISTTIIMLLSVFFISETYSQNTEKAIKHRIVIQFSSGDTLAQKGLRNNIRNLTTAMPDAEIEVVCHGPGVNFLRTNTTNFASDIENYRQKGVVFAVCENTLKERKIDKSEILPNMIFVPNGLVEIISKQEKSWSYIKAGF